MFDECQKIQGRDAHAGRYATGAHSKYADHYRQPQNRTDRSGRGMVSEVFSRQQPDRLAARPTRLFAQGNFPVTKKVTEYPKRCLREIFDANHAAEEQALIRSFEEAVRLSCERECRVEFIDAVEEAECVVQQQIFETPMLVKELPEPMSRVSGDLKDACRVLMMPGLLIEEQERK